MAVKRSVNWLSQGRVDVPDVRAIESSTRNDFDELIKSLVTGTNQGYILTGFEISMAGAIGGAASGLQLLVDPGAVLHINSSQSGTFFLVPPGTLPQQLNSATNTIVDGAFAPSAINYVSLEYERYIDDTTSAQVYLWNPTTKSETTKSAPRAQVLRFRIKITTSTPASNYLPIAAITTDSGNNVTRIDNARFELWSQGAGGLNPNPFYQYQYPDGYEPNPTFSTSNSVNPFRGGDRGIKTLKEKLDAITTEIQNIKGTPYWTSLSSSGSLESIRADLGNTIITGRGNISHDPDEDTPGKIVWSDDIHIRVIGSRLAYKLSANVSSDNVVLAENDVAYVNLVRGVAIVPNLIFTNNSKIVTSVGAISWTGSLQSGDWIKLGPATDAFYYQIDTVDSLTQVTLLTNYGESSTGPSGAKSKYSYGVYQSSATPSSNRDIYIAQREDVPAGENVFWLYLRSDNADTIARVYIRFLGMELQDGETEEISDNIPLQLLRYLGSPVETASKPQYVSALDPGSVPQIEDVTFADAAGTTQNSYFLLNSSNNTRSYYVWFNKDAAGTDPFATGRTGIEVAITTGMTNAQVAQAAAQAINAIFYPDFDAAQKVAPNQHVLRITWNSAGATVGVNNFDMASPWAFTTFQTGTGTGNSIVNDGDNLTLGIKKLDRAFGTLLSILDSASYDEAIDIVSGTPAGTNYTLPLNSRHGNAQQFYTVGNGILLVFLNGQYQRIGVDWDEVGSPGDASDEITIQRDLVIGDILEFRVSIGGSGMGGGGGGPGPQGDPGPAGPAGTDAVGGPVAVSTKIADYTVSLGDNVLKGDCSVNGQDIIFSLPTAASAVGYVFFFKKTDASAFTVYIQANGAELIDGLNIQALTVQYEGFMLVSDGTVWSIH